MNEQDPTPNSLGDESQRKTNPRHITSLRMFRTLLPLSDERMGLGSDESIERNRQEASQLLLWPPNLFAFTSEILRSTGIYYLVVSPASSEGRDEIWPPPPGTDKDGKQEAWVDKVRHLGREWRKTLNQKPREFFSTHLEPDDNPDSEKLRRILNSLVPGEVLECWDKLAAGFDNKDIKNLRCIVEDPKERKEHWQAFVALMTLHAVADEACLGWGLRERVDNWDEPGKKGERLGAQTFAEELLERRGTLATIHEDRCRILPKRHTPNVGMTLRSVSTNLAFFHRSSIDIRWRRSVKTPLTEEVKLGPSGKISSLNVLLIPWPYEILASDFSAVTGEQAYQAHREKESFFEYDPQRSEKEEHFIKNELTPLLQKAKDEAKRIDLVILPELAIAEKNVDEFERRLKAEDISGYIAGVRLKKGLQIDGTTNRFNRNTVYCKFSEKAEGERRTYNFPPHGELGDQEDYRQHKHHRWKLDKQQVVKYQLGGALSTNRNWWEFIKLGRRKVTFINVGDEITICPLICEDLARQEPISDLIRAVGPTLVVAILMDGPQKWSRWSAEYASVLADDPGSSVLTFTCKGMVERVRNPGTEKSRAIALWKDPLGLPHEIELDDEKTRGVVLYLNVEEKKEITADGREEDVPTPYLTLGGIRYVSDKD
jgi:hypothetical protein